MLQEPTNTTFLPPDTVPVDKIWQAVRRPYAIERTRQTRGRRRYYDTFDWRLYRAGLALLWEEDRYELRSLDRDEVVASLEAVGQAGWTTGPFPVLRHEVSHPAVQTADGVHVGAPDRWNICVLHQVRGNCHHALSAARACRST